MRRPIFETLNFHFYNMAKVHPFIQFEKCFTSHFFLVVVVSCIPFSISTHKKKFFFVEVNPMYLVCKQARQGTLQFALSISAFSVIFSCQIINERIKKRFFISTNCFPFHTLTHTHTFLAAIL